MPTLLTPKDHRTFTLLVWALILPWGITTAQQAKTTAATGSTVSGHVSCADTNAPARLARVSLTALRGDAPLSSATPGTTTDMDGAFSIPSVPPGRYLVLAELDGYVSGISGLDQAAREDLGKALHAPPEGSAVIEVADGVAASVDLTLLRGAAVSGVIHYDDGSPAIGILVALERKNSKGNWESPLESTTQAFSFLPGAHEGNEATDSAGHFHLGSMPAGAYLLHAHIQPQTITMPVSGNGAVGIFNHSELQLDLYNGDVFWKKDATPFKLGEGEEQEIDLTIPLSRLHTLAGTVTALNGSHAVNSGSVSLVPQGDPADADDARSAQVHADGTFRFQLLPEGDYRLTIDDAADADAQVGATPTPAHVPKTYGRAETNVHVSEDRNDITLTVPDRKQAGTETTQP